MKVTVLYNEVGAAASTDDLDVLVQRDAVVASLARLGHDVSTLGCSLDLSAVHAQLTRRRPDAVFNLVESLGGTDRSVALATAGSICGRRTTSRPRSKPSRVSPGATGRSSPSA